MAKTITIKKMAIVSLMTAILCILSPISVPVFISPVPISLGVLAIYLTAYVLEPVEALISVVYYLVYSVYLYFQDIQAVSEKYLDLQVGIL